jgi:positive regulator of sigma E activity
MLAATSTLGYVVLVVVWVGFMFLGARINEWKGRSEAWGAVIAFLFGLLGVLVLALLPRKR